MIATCKSRYSDSVEPLVVPKPNGQVAVYCFDGSGAWGNGNEAAAWFREWVALRSGESDEISPSAINGLLRAGIRVIPSSVTDCEYHWAFSLSVVICSPQEVYVGGSGSFAVVALRGLEMERLRAPMRLVDELVARGEISPDQAKTHRFRRVICRHAVGVGAFGMNDEVDLAWSQPSKWADGDRIVIGDAALPKYLEKVDFELQTSIASEIRDAVEAYGGSSAPTAVIGFPETSG